jgi:DNA repair exonuclease SbcCD ATPase subunit
MIVFEKVRWMNFLSTGNVFTEVDLNRDSTTLIIGENGSGKSTILDALCFGLFGKPFRNIKKDQLINSVNNKKTIVEVEFVIGSTHYLVRRCIRPGKFEIEIDGKLQDRLASVRDQQRTLEETILKLSYYSFTQIVILGNASFIPFMQLHARERRDIIEDLLDIKIFSAMNDLLSERMKGNKERLDQVKYEVNILNEKITIHKKHLEELKANSAAHKTKLFAEIDKANKFIDKTQQKVEKLDAAINQLAEYDEKESKLKGKLSKIDGLESRLEEKKKENLAKIKFYSENNSCPTCFQGITEDTKHEHVTESKSKVQELEDGLSSLNEEYEKITKSLVTVAEKLKAKNDKITQKIELASAIQQQLTYVTRVNTEIADLEKDTTSEDDEKTELAKLKKELTSSSKKHEALVYERSLFETAYGLLRDKGIKTAIIRQYVPIINQLVNKYLSALEFFVQFELDDEFNEIIKSRYRDEFTYPSFSEGEKMRIDLALLFTWRAIAKMKNSTNTNLLIMDEVFDASLDNSGCDEFLKLVHQLGEDTRVFVISHKGDILQDKFSNTLRFEKHKNFSRIAA